MNVDHLSIVHRIISIVQRACVVALLQLKRNKCYSVLCFWSDKKKQIFMFCCSRPFSMYHDFVRNQILMTRIFSCIMRYALQIIKERYATFSLFFEFLFASIKFAFSHLVAQLLTFMRRRIYMRILVSHKNSIDIFWNWFFFSFSFYYFFYS